MQRTLRLHPDCRRGPVSRIDVEMLRPDSGHLVLRYVLKGMIGEIALPPLAAPLRTDELWRHSCFEAFVLRPNGYCEFNFAPSTAWAAYAFDGYRSGMRPLDLPPPVLQANPGTEEFSLTATFEVPPGPLRLALSAVIENTDGSLSYWALQHPPGKPDFHHPDAFALEIP